MLCANLRVAHDFTGGNGHLTPALQVTAAFVAPGEVNGEEACWQPGRGLQGGPLQTKVKDHNRSASSLQAVEFRMQKVMEASCYVSCTNLEGLRKNVDWWR